MPATSDTLSVTLSALADPTRRAILLRLAHGPATVKELSAPFEMSGPAVSKHLRVLERAGLIQRGRAPSTPARSGRWPNGPASSSGSGTPATRGSTPTSITSSDRRSPMATATKTGVTTYGTPTDREIVVTRVVDAPRRLVFAAWTDPRHIPQWLLGPEGWTMPICELDLRPGGAWRYVWRKSD